MESIITLIEILKMAIMTLAVAFIFRAALGLQRELSFWKGMGYAAAVAAPAIILHEFGHKFVAMGFGFHATFDIPIFWLLLGVALVLIRAPFIFFVPAFIRIIGQTSPAQTGLIAFAGPGVNLLLYVIAIVVQKNAKLSHKGFLFWTVTRKINGFLSVFNLIPFPPFDGFSVFSSLFTLLGF